MIRNSRTFETLSGRPAQINAIRVVAGGWHASVNIEGRDPILLVTADDLPLWWLSEEDLLDLRNPDGVRSPHPDDLDHAIERAERKAR